MPIEFINADLEITSSEDLEPIRAFFAQYGHRFSEMYCGSTEPGSYLASFEVHPDEERDDQTAEEKIGAFCRSLSCKIWRVKSGSVPQGESLILVISQMIFAVRSMIVFQSTPFAVWKCSDLSSL